MLNGLLSSDVSGQLRGEVYFQSHSLKKKILHSITLIYYIMQLNRCIKNVCVCVGDFTVNMYFSSRASSGYTGQLFLLRTTRAGCS